MTDRTCRVCDADITHRRPDAVYCTKRCRKWADRHGLTVARVDGPIAVRCERCGTNFTTRNPRKRFCTETCRKRAEVSRRRPQIRAYHLNRAPTHATCDHCATEFSYIRRGRSQRFCSHACYAASLRTRDPAERAAQKHKRRRERERKAAERAYLAIVRRDPCAYCGAPGEALDHITPRATNGPNDWDNMTSACHTCNALKNDKPLLTGLLYIGISHEIAALTSERARLAA